MYKRTSLLIISFLLLTSYSNATGQSEKSLKGIKEVNVLIEELHPDIEQDGLRRNTIRADVETALKRGGIKVVNESEKDAEVVIYIVVGSTKFKSNPIYAFNVQFIVEELATIKRINKTMMVSTYEKSQTGACTVENLNYIRETIREVVDTFLADHKVANR